MKRSLKLIILALFAVSITFAQGFEVKAAAATKEPCLVNCQKRNKTSPRKPRSR